MSPSSEHCRYRRQVETRYRPISKSPSRRSWQSTIRRSTCRRRTNRRSTSRRSTSKRSPCRRSPCSRSRKSSQSGRSSSKDYLKIIEEKRYQLERILLNLEEYIKNRDKEVHDLEQIFQKKKVKSLILRN